MENLDKLIIYYYPLKLKKRYGPNFDGGYILADNIPYDILL